MDIKIAQALVNMQIDIEDAMFNCGLSEGQYAETYNRVQNAMDEAKYAFAQELGYSGSEEEFTEYMLSLGA